MWQSFHIFYFVSIFIPFINTQVLYQCNFDGANENCFTSTITLTTNVGNANNLVPNGALSDVSSIIKPTANGEMCILPYKVGTYTWDMYFCNKGFCPTASNPNSTCTTGKFGSTQLTNNDKKVFQLKTESDGISGKDQQCLTYYYYMAVVGQKTIEIRKEEVDGESVIIDSVTSSPFNGWTVRRVSFNAKAPGYKIYFEAQRTTTAGAPYIGFDEISIQQGSCEDEPITDTPATTPIPITTTVTTTTTISTTAATTTTTTTVTITTPIPTAPTTTTTTVTTPSTTTTPMTTTPTTTTSTIPTDAPSTTTTTTTTTQVLYQCNFDGLVDTCFTTTILMTQAVGVVSGLVPNGALSDVSSITKPTANGEMCILPYKVLSTYNWDMYFCNKGFCPTASNPNSTCATGRFGTIPLANSNKREFQLRTESGGINGKDQQCLTYYYYMGNVSQKIIEIRKEEVSGESVIIDSVTSSPFNGWIVRKISFNAAAPGYKIYFEVQRTTTTGAPNVGLDEISIHQGSCGDEPITDTPATTLVPITTTVTTTVITTTTTTISTTAATTTTTTTVTITTPIPTTSTTTTTTTTTIPSTTTTPTTTTPTTTTSTIQTDPPSTTTTTVTTTTTPTDPPSTTTRTTTVTTTTTPTDPPSTTTTTTTTTSTPTDPPSTTTTATTTTVTTTTTPTGPPSTTTITTRAVSTPTDPPSTTTTTTTTVSTPTDPPSTMTTTKTTQVIYQCSFDGETENCFDSTPPITVTASVNVAGPVAPSAALSDVSSIIKPTANGEMCILPYKVGTYTWDMYFCNRGYCPTASNPNSTCASGKYGNIALNNNQTRKFQLKTETDGINGKGQQCLTYYYYMPVTTDKIINI
ncbi:unnamed protein product, partial [Adineta steineri]